MKAGQPADKRLSEASWILSSDGVGAAAQYHPEAIFIPYFVGPLLLLPAFLAAWLHFFFCSIDHLTRYSSLFLLLLGWLSPWLPLYQHQRLSVRFTLRGAFCFLHAAFCKFGTSYLSAFCLSRFPSINHRSLTQRQRIPSSIIPWSLHDTYCLTYK